MSGLCCNLRVRERHTLESHENGCSTCPRGSDFFIDQDALGGVSLQAVSFGHFTSPGSDDALLSMLGCESHARYFGGSFLLTRRGGKWHLRGYHPRLITE